MLTRRRALILGTMLPLAYALPARAQSPETYAEGGIAVDGTDVVAYFTQSAPVPGDPDITHDWNGATWRFSTTANRDAFAADPARYAPQYGGYCAYAVSEGYTASTVPEAWKIVDGKLYLNYSRRVQRWWERDISGRIASGDANWPKVLN
ncbi:MAG: YHS domain-containing (seleno)protein [Pseudomonadota bacterium]